MLFGQKDRSIVLSQVLLVGWLFAMTSTSLAQGDTWTKKADMLTNRLGLATSVEDGKIYAIGGGPSPGAGIPTVEAYDPATDTWTTKADMPTARIALSTSAVNGMIYALGGRQGFSLLSTVEAYDPATDTWTTKRSMPGSDGPEDGVRWGLAASTVNGRIYAIGGALDPVPPHPGLNLMQEYTAPMVATGVDDPADEQNYPGRMALYPNYPNPFTPSTDIRFELPEAQPVRLVVYDVLGRAVRVLVNGVRRAGMHKVVFEAGDLPSGTYLYRLETPKGRFSGTMHLVK